MRTGEYCLGYADCTVVRVGSIGRPSVTRHVGLVISDLLHATKRRVMRVLVPRLAEPGACHVRASEC